MVQTTMRNVFTKICYNQIVAGLEDTDSGNDNNKIRTNLTLGKKASELVKLDEVIFNVMLDGNTEEALLDEVYVTADTNVRSLKHRLQFRNLYTDKTDQHRKR